jgi:hypothetical protein
MQKRLRNSTRREGNLMEFSDSDNGVFREASMLLLSDGTRVDKISLSKRF